MPRTPATPALLMLPFALAVACGTSPHREHAPPPPTDVAWAIAVHGGAGTIDRNAPAAELQAYRDSLRAALTLGRDRLQRGDAALDVCAAVVQMLEDDPLFNAGRGAAFDEQGGHSLDASIMDGASLRCGAVADVRTVRHPIELARLVMTQTKHVLLAGPGAEQFADAMQVERVPNEWFDTERRRKVLEEVLRERQRGGTAQASSRSRQGAYGTVGCVVRDAHGHLAAATSTGGLTGKKFGRVGDSPLIGAGNYADGWAAVSGTGTGEEFIRHAVAHSIAARMRFGGQSLQDAVDAVVFHTLQKDDGGVIAVDAAGNLAAVYNSDGMYRALADSKGRFEVRIFED